MNICLVLQYLNPIRSYFPLCTSRYNKNLQKSNNFATSLPRSHTTWAPETCCGFILPYILCVYKLWEKSGICVNFLCWSHTEWPIYYYFKLKSYHIFFSLQLWPIYLVFQLNELKVSLCAYCYTRLQGTDWTGSLCRLILRQTKLSCMQRCIGLILKGYRYIVCVKHGSLYSVVIIRHCMYMYAYNDDFKVAQ